MNTTASTTTTTAPSSLDRTPNSAAPTSTTPPENNTLELPFVPASTVPPAVSDDPQMDPVVGCGQRKTAGDRPATIVNVIQVAINALKPHPTNAAVYGDEPVDGDLVASIKALNVINPLHATVEHVIVDGHRRLKAARAAGLTMVPVIVLPGSHDALAIEELLLESNRSRTKNNEQRVREFIAFQRIEAERAKARAGRRTDLLPKSAGGSSAEVTGSARDLAAKKVGMSGSRAAHGEAVVAVIDRLNAEGDLEAAQDLREILNEKTVETAHGAAIKHGWINVAPKRQYREAAVEIKEDKAVGDSVEATPFSAAMASAPAESDSPLHIARVPDAQETAHAAIDPSEEAPVHINARTGVEQEFVLPQMSTADGQNNQPTNVLPVVAAPEPQSTGAENQPPVPGRIFRLADGNEVMIATGEADLITDMKLRAILQVSVSLGDKDSVGVEALTRRQRMEMSVAEMMNRLGKEYPDVPAQRLWKEFCISNLIFQKQMKWN